MMDVCRFPRNCSADLKVRFNENCFPIRKPYRVVFVWWQCRSDRRNLSLVCVSWLMLDCVRLPVARAELHGMGLGCLRTQARAVFEKDANMEFFFRKIAPF